ncbi:hypothetical protein [Sandaracinus amylolyticus]|uniref:Uncharacterized protein n=1 Tax=Sandaracinus amylolyticus TaxID=927083 RepID=A0A0F6W7R0_9BACT|nr:hypothetical protein [Sandaracinus amylolyticus]AKF09427.1 hypothetical protein DB32_006576 [Sandaracinus amylolyticus]
MIDPYVDGIAITLELSRPVSEADRDVAARLLDEWLAAYEGEPMRYRNSASDAVRGATRIVLWADRIDDPEGASAALTRAHATLDRAKRALPVVSGRVTSAEDASSADLEARLGTTPIVVQPGGDSAARFLAGLHHARTPSGLRPRIAWLAPAIIARLVARGLDGAMAALLSDGAVLVTIVALSIASRAWLTRREHVLGAAAVLAAVTHTVVALRGLDSTASLVRLVVTLAAVAWAACWLSRGREAR